MAAIKLSSFNLSSSVSVQDGMMYSVSDDGTRKPVLFKKQAGRTGVFKQNAKPKKGTSGITAKMTDNASIVDQNLINKDVARLHPMDSTLQIDFSLMVMPFLSEFGATHLIRFEKTDKFWLRDAFKDFLSYGVSLQLDELAYRYVVNMVKAKYARRNIEGSSGEVQITYLSGKEKGSSVHFDSEEVFSLLSTKKAPERAKETAELTEKVQSIAKKLVEAWRGERPSVKLNVKLTIDLIPGAEVFPGQPIDKRKETDGRTYSFLEGVFFDENGLSISAPFLHSENIGNALKEIAVAPDGKFVTVNPYLNNPKEGVVYFPPNGLKSEHLFAHLAKLQKKFLDLAKDFTGYDKALEAKVATVWAELNKENPEVVRFVAANLLFGGFFTEKTGNKK